MAMIFTFKDIPAFMYENASTDTTDKRKGRALGSLLLRSLRRVGELNELVVVIQVVPPGVLLGLLGGGQDL